MKTHIFIAAAGFVALTSSHQALAAQQVIHAYGPGGPFPAIKEAAAAYNSTHPDTKIAVTAGPTPKWRAAAEKDADILFSGSEIMMAEFTKVVPQLDPATIQPLYLRAAAILVRPGNPAHITGFASLLQSGHKILVVNGAGQQGLWEDIAGRLGHIQDVTAFRRNIEVSAGNSAEAKAAWQKDKSLDAWVIWTIWQKANPTLAEIVPIEPERAIYRDAGIGLTKAGEEKPAAKDFVLFIESRAGAAIFEKWGWTKPMNP